MRTQKKIKILIIISILIISFIVLKYDILLYIKNKETLEIFLNKFNVWAPITYIFLYSLTTITTITTIPLTIISGLLFGPLYGIIYIIIGATFGMTTSFLIARYLAKDFIEKRFGNIDIFKKINEGVNENDWFILAITRLLPIFPFGIQNYIYGLTSINLFKYIIFSTLFILPGTSVFVLLAGAVTLGNTKEAIKVSLIASSIFLGITIISKIIQKNYIKK